MKNMIIDFLWKILGKKYALGGAVAVYKKVNGWKTYLSIIAIVIIYAGKALGYIPVELAEQLLALFGGTASVAFLHKLQKTDEEFGIAEKLQQLRAEAVAKLKEDKVIPPVDNASMDPAILAEADRIIKELRALRG